MATVVGVTDVRAQDIEDASVVSGAIVNGVLVLTTGDNTEIIVGTVVDNTSLPAHEVDTSTHGVSQIVGLSESQSLTNKTLVTPTIASFVNAQHDHSDADDGGIVALSYAFSNVFTEQTVSSGSPGPKTMASITLPSQGMWIVMTNCRGFTTNGVACKVEFSLVPSDGNFGGSNPQQVKTWDGTLISDGFSMAALYVSGAGATPVISTKVEYLSGSAASATTSTVGKLSAVRLGPSVTL